MSGEPLGSEGRPDTGATTPVVDRRRALGTMAAGAAVAWVVPTVMSVPSAAASGAGCTTCGANLVKNPSFETGAFLPWVPSGATSIGTSPPLAVPVTDGTKYAFFSATDARLQQTFAVDAGCAGKSWTLDFDLFVQGTMEVEVGFLGSVGPVIATTFYTNVPGGLTMAPQTMSGVVPASTTSVVINFTLSPNVNGATVDNVRFVIGC